MPLYEYRCTKCGAEMEVLQKFSDPPKRRCRKCHGKLEKLISRTSFQLKGGGWFEQGYGGSSRGRASGSSSSSTGSGSSSTGSGSGDSDSGSKASAATA